VIDEPEFWQELQVEKMQFLLIIEIKQKWLFDIRLCMEMLPELLLQFEICIKLKFMN
jgi:hypothetical protein